MLLAGLSARKLDDYVFSAGFVALTAKTIVIPSRLAEEIKRVHLTGYAVDSGEFFDGVRAIAVPVRIGDGQVIAALSLAGLAMPLDNIACLVRGAQRQRRCACRQDRPHSRRVAGAELPRTAAGSC